MLRDKRLTELSRGSGRGEWWSIGTDRNAAWEAVIEELCGCAPVYCDNEWRFEVADPAATIPLIVRRLAGLGCSIRNVTPRAAEFSEVIRREYRVAGAPSGAPDKGVAP